MNAWRLLLLAAILVLQSTALQARPDRSHELANTFLARSGLYRALDKMPDTIRPKVINRFVEQGRTDEQAAHLADRLVVPALREHVPELRTRYVDMVAQLFTPAELHALVHNESNRARLTAAAKNDDMHAKMHDVSAQWIDEIMASLILPVATSPEMMAPGR